MSEHTMRVLIADDNETTRRLITLLLEPNLRVVGDVADGCAAVIAAVGLQPDVVLMDYQMPLMDGLTATRLIKQLPHPPRVVIFTGADVTLVQPLADAVGADAVLEKGSSLLHLSQTLTNTVGDLSRAA